MGAGEPGVGLDGLRDTFLCQEGVVFGLGVCCCFDVCVCGSCMVVISSEALDELE